MNRSDYILGKNPKSDYIYMGKDEVNISLAELGRRGQNLLNRVNEKIQKQKDEHESNFHQYQVIDKGDTRTWHLDYYQTSADWMDGRVVGVSDKFIHTMLGNFTTGQVSWTEQRRVRRDQWKNLRGKVLVEDSNRDRGYIYKVRWDEIGNTRPVIKMVSWFQAEDLNFE